MGSGLVILLLNVLEYFGFGDLENMYIVNIRKRKIGFVSKEVKFKVVNGFRFILGLFN